MTEPTQPPSRGAVARAEFLKEVTQLVCRDRNVQHGDAEDNFRVIAELWTTYLRARRSNSTLVSPITSLDVAVMMGLTKTARLAANPLNRDNWLDQAGYAACGGVIAQGQRPTDFDKTMADMGLKTAAP